METPQATVIIMAYNRKDFLKDAILSVASQVTERDKIEVLIVKNFEHPDIDYLINKIGFTSLLIQTNESSGSYLGYALEHSHAELICLLDDDDMFYPQKLDTIIAEFQRDPKLIYYHNANRRIDVDGVLLENSGSRSSTVQLVTTGNNGAVNAIKLVRALNRRGDVNNSSICFKTSISKNLKELLMNRRSIDITLFSLALESGGNLLIDNRKLTKFRMHESFSHFSGPDKLINTVKYNNLTVIDYTDLMGKLKGQTSRRYLYCNSLSARINSFTVLGKRARLSVREFFLYLGCFRYMRTGYFAITLSALLISLLVPTLNSRIFQLYNDRVSKKFYLSTVK